MSRKQWGHGFWTGMNRRDPENRGPEGLVGLWFHSHEGEKTPVQWQGQIIGKISDDRYSVQLYSWLDRRPTVVKLVAFSDMEHWTFYSTSEDMNYAWERKQAMGTY